MIKKICYEIHKKWSEFNPDYEGIEYYFYYDHQLVIITNAKNDDDAIRLFNNEMQIMPWAGSIIYNYIKL